MVGLLSFQLILLYTQLYFILWKENNIVTFQEAILLDKYSKAYYKSGILIQEELFVDGKIYGFNYHNWDHENHKVLFNTYFDPKYIDFQIIEHSSFKGNLTLEKLFSYYDNGSLVGIRHSLYDFNKDLIGHEVFLDDSKTPDYSNTMKFYWNRAVNPDRKIFDVRFDRDTGAFRSINFKELHVDITGQSSFSLLNTPEDIQKLIAITGMSQELAEYYTVPEVIPTF